MCLFEAMKNENKKRSSFAVSNFYWNFDNYKNDNTNKWNKTYMTGGNYAESCLHQHNMKDEGKMRNTFTVSKP